MSNIVTNDKVNSSTEVDSEVSVGYLGAHELKLAASILYQAYHDDPVFIEIFSGQQDDYEQRLRGAIREELNAFWQAKQPILGLYIGESLIGVACINSPDDTLSSERFWHWRLKMLLNAGYFSTKQMIQKEESVLAAVPLNVFHFLSFVAIHPLHQEHGLGHYLISGIHTILSEHKESEGIAVYATTDKFKHFFEHLGYQAIKDVTVGKVSGSIMVHKRTA